MAHHTSVIPAFLDDLAAHGIRLVDPSDVTADGRIHRTNVEGDRRNAKNLAYKIHDDDRPAWWFQDHKRGITASGSLRIEREPPTAEQRAAWAARAAERRAEIEREYAAAAVRAAEMYAAAGPVDPAHPYLVRKGLTAAGAVPASIRQDADGRLVIPVYTDFGQLSSLQTIAPDGEKLFLPGGRMQGGFFPINGTDRTRVLAAEGVATGLALAAVTGCSVACAMSSGNLPAIVAFLRAKFPDRETVVAADNDHGTERRIGTNPGIAAARSITPPVRIVAPDFLPDDPGTDWDDWLRAGGSPDDLRARIAPPADPTPPPAPDAPADDDTGGRSADPEADAIDLRNLERPVGRVQPLDFFRKLALPPLRRRHLPPALADFVFDQSEIVGSDPGILALSALVTLASCIHDEIKIQPRRYDPSWQESARLWGAFVGDPSVKKTPAVKRAISHAKKIDMGLHESSSGDIARYLLAEKVHKKAEAEYVKARSASAGYTPDDAAPEPPRKPPVLRLVVEDTTVEALGVILADNPRGVLVLHDELSGWFGSMDAYRQSGNAGKDRSHWLEAYNGGPKRIDRLSRAPLVVPNWSCCVLGGIQPSAIRKIARDMSEDGLMQRFMIVMATEQDGLGHDRSPDLEALQGYRDLMDQVFATTPSATPVRLTPDGIDAREALESEMKTLRGFSALPARFRSALGKWDGLFPRLCLTYHCIESAAAHVHPASRPVSRDTCERVSAFMREYLFHHGLAFYADVLEDSDRMEHVKWIAGHILAAGLSELTTRIIQRAYPKWKDLPEWVQRDTLRVLEDGGWIFGYRANLGKRITRWVVNEEVHSRFAGLAEAEAARRIAIRERMGNLRSAAEAE